MATLSPRVEGSSATNPVVDTSARLVTGAVADRLTVPPKVMVTEVPGVRFSPLHTPKYVWVTGSKVGAYVPVDGVNGFAGFVTVYWVGSGTTSISRTAVTVVGP